MSSVNDNNKTSFDAIQSYFQEKAKDTKKKGLLRLVDGKLRVVKHDKVTIFDRFCNFFGLAGYGLKNIVEWVQSHKTEAQQYVLGDEQRLESFYELRRSVNKYNDTKPLLKKVLNIFRGRISTDTLDSMPGNLLCAVQQRLKSAQQEVIALKELYEGQLYNIGDEESDEGEEAWRYLNTCRYFQKDIDVVLEKIDGLNLQKLDWESFKGQYDSLQKELGALNSKISQWKDTLEKAWIKCEVINAEQSLSDAVEILRREMNKDPFSTYEQKIKRFQKLVLPNLEEQDDKERIELSEGDGINAEDYIRFQCLIDHRQYLNHNAKLSREAIVSFVSVMRHLYQSKEEQYTQMIIAEAKELFRNLPLAEKKIILTCMEKESEVYKGLQEELKKKPDTFHQALVSKRFFVSSNNSERLKDQDFQNLRLLQLTPELLWRDFTDFTQLILMDRATISSQYSLKIDAASSFVTMMLHLYSLVTNDDAVEGGPKEWFSTGKKFFKSLGQQDQKNILKIFELNIKNFQDEKDKESLVENCKKLAQKLQEDDDTEGWTLLPNSDQPQTDMQETVFSGDYSSSIVEKSTSPTEEESKIPSWAFNTIPENVKDSAQNVFLGLLSIQQPIPSNFRLNREQVFSFVIVMSDLYSALTVVEQAEDKGLIQGLLSQGIEFLKELSDQDRSIIYACAEANGLDLRSNLANIISQSSSK